MNASILAARRITGGAEREAMYTGGHAEWKGREEPEHCVHAAVVEEAESTNLIAHERETDRVAAVFEHRRSERVQRAGAESPHLLIHVAQVWNL
jgi:hypothetical protein